MCWRQLRRSAQHSNDLKVRFRRDGDRGDHGGFLRPRLRPWLPRSFRIPVLTAISDCSSSTSYRTHDDVGGGSPRAPTAVIVAAEFCHQARMIRAALGMPDLYTAVTDPSAEPQSTLTDARGE